MATSNNTNTTDTRHLIKASYNSISASYTDLRSRDAVPELSLITSHFQSSTSSSTSTSASTKPPIIRILDLGCGAGLPIAHTLTSSTTHDFHVTGIDISEQQIERARVNVPRGRFICADILSLSFDFDFSLDRDLDGSESLSSSTTTTTPTTPTDGAERSTTTTTTGAEDEDEDGRSFDAILAFYSIFHLPRSKHGLVFDRVAKWLKSGGLFLATVSCDDGNDGNDDGNHDDNDDDNDDDDTGTTTGEGAIIADFFGVDMYWSSWGLGRYKTMLEDRGFEILANEVVVDMDMIDDDGRGGRGGTKKVFEWASSEVDKDNEHRHPLLFARKKKKKEIKKAH